MNSQLHWDDLRVALAIAVAGTLSGAGRRLGLSHATVFRRIGDIEDRAGVKLFERSRTGYSATVAGEEAAATARRVETEVLELERRIAGRDLRPSGTVRVTTTDTLFVGFLSPVFTEFRKTYRDIDLEIAVSNDLFSLSKREADVAVRPASAPPETLVGRKIGTIAQAIYGRKDFVPKKRAPNATSTPWRGSDRMRAWRIGRWTDG